MKIISKLLIVIGIVLILSSALYLVKNDIEAAIAGKESDLRLGTAAD